MRALDGLTGLSGAIALKTSKMKVIQIAPYESDCRIVGNEIIGTMGGRTFVFEIPSQYEVYSYQHKHLISRFREAIALCSKPWQVERLLNDHLGIEGGKFREE